tara:strand:+ start:1430 stop:1831 length:402 start_codon:yes stop_codon:yes gene_type:complete
MIIIETERYRYAQSEDEIRYGLNQIEQKWQSQGITLSLGVSFSGAIDVHTIIIPKEKRKQGIGTQIVQEVIDYANSVERRIELSPGTKDDYHGTTSRNRLIRWYKGLGFVENRGRNKDFRTRSTMFRRPDELV